MSKLTPVQQYYKGKTVFITGATGFMGKVLLEKLLYSCSELKEIIIICRAKKGKAPESRLEDMWQLPIFQRIKDEKPHILKKVTVFEGDITNEMLGLSEDNLNHVAANTNIVFHIAALLKMVGNLADSIDMNICGTRRAMDVARKMKNLEAFVHLSTTFCNNDHNVVYEQVYDHPHKPEDLMRLAEWMDVKTLNDLNPHILAPLPNNYTYTKRLTELYVRDQYETMPVIIARPSIVTSAHKEPLPGWVDNMNGLIGIIVSFGKGVLRSLMTDLDTKYETIPVDHAITGLIVIPFHVSEFKTRPSEIPVFNLTLPDHLKHTTRWFFENSIKLNAKYPISWPLWYPNATFTLNKYYYWLNVILFMWLPALLIDGLLTIFGQKRFMMRMHKRLMSGIVALEFFTINSWFFRNDNFKKLCDSLSPEDAEIFPHASNDFNTDEYLMNCCVGARSYLCKDTVSTISKDRMVVKVMYILDRVCKALTCSCLFYWLALKFGY